MTMFPVLWEHRKIESAVQHTKGLLFFCFFTNVLFGHELIHSSIQFRFEQVDRSLGFEQHERNTS